MQENFKHQSRKKIQCEINKLQEDIRRITSEGLGNKNINQKQKADMLSRKIKELKQFLKEKEQNE